MTEPASPIAPAPPEPGLPRARQIRIVVLVVLGVAAALVLGFGLRALLTPRPPAPEVLPPDTFRPTAEQLRQLRIVPAGLGADATVLRAAGSIAADADHSTPILLPFSGQVSRVYVEPGQAVSVGTPLLAVASPELVDARNTLLGVAAQAATAAAQLRTAEQNAARQRALYETAGGAQKDYLQAQTDLVTAQSNARTAQSALRSAQDRLGLFGKSAGEIRALQSPVRALGSGIATVYRSPVAGVVADRSVAPGQFLSAGGSAALMTITDPSRVWLVAQLPESEAANVHLGDMVEVTTPAVPGRSFHARIDNIGAALDPASHRLPVRATVDNRDGLLKPQMFASFAIRRQLGGPAGTLVPAESVIYEGDSARVWVLGRDGLLHARRVQTGESEDGLTLITSGLGAGERVVAGGALFVNEAGLNP